MNLFDYLADKLPGIDAQGALHVARVILNKDHFNQEPLITKAMGINSRNCEFCQKEQANSQNRHVFCRRHLMLYELKKYYINPDCETVVFKYNDLFIFPQKYAVKWFQNVVVCSFTSKHILQKDIYYLLKFSFLNRDLRETLFTSVIDISELSSADELDVKTDTLHLTLRNTQNKGFEVACYEELCKEEPPCPT